ncbi:putative alginate lyase [Fennellomyces sp. T-0311]|nr:putative alginate lyase [Fennellomyces sp. T-0311]
MPPKKPEIEYIHLQRLTELKQAGEPQGEYAEAYDDLRKLAQGALKQGPFSVTTGKAAPHIAASGDPRDFLSYAPYVFFTSLFTVYVRHDGKRNPDCKSVQDQSQLEALAENLTFLCLGYYLLGKPEYAQHAVSLIDAFFVNNDTRMNPHVNYGQVVRGANNPSGKGRGEGIISTRVLARVANVLPLLSDHASYASVAQPVQEWFAQYLRWLQESDIGKQEASMKNNHLTWYLVQVAAIQQFLDPNKREGVRTIEQYYKDTLGKQIDKSNGNQPLEATRTRPFHYLEFNLHAAVFLAEMAIEAGRSMYDQQQLVPLATAYMTDCCKPDMNENMTEGIRTVEIVKSRYGDTGNKYANFLNLARTCKDAGCISGPKNGIARLWFRDDGASECPPHNSNENTPSNNNNGNEKRSRAKGFLDKLLHRHKN